MTPARRPLLTLTVHQALIAARAASAPTLRCSLDLGLSDTKLEIAPDHWRWEGAAFPYLETCKDRNVYVWTGREFAVAARFSNGLIKLVATDWGPPTFEIDGIKMLPTAHLSPYTDAQNKVALIHPRGKVVLDTCGGLGYFAAWCLRGGARRILSYEKNADVLWLRSLNPWSPDAETHEALTLHHADITETITALPDASVDAALHDPPRFGIAGELYSQTFYHQLARVIRPQGRLFHYTGSPNRLTSRRDVPTEVARRLQQAGFRTEMSGDGVLAIRMAAPARR